MSPEDDEADDRDVGPDDDPDDEHGLDPDESTDDLRRADRTADDEPGDSGTVDDEGGDSGPSDSPPSRSDEFGIASDLVSGRGSDGDDADRTSPGEQTGDPGRTHGNDGDPVSSGGSPPDEAGTVADAPLSSLAASVDERRDRAADRPDDELFDEEDVPEIDADFVWERLGEDEPPEIPEETEHDVRVIEKRSYCEQCPFFATPPDVSCTHEGTEIVEMVDMEHFRVVNCPKVREDERLERL